MTNNGGEAALAKSHASKKWAWVGGGKGGRGVLAVLG